MFYGAACTFKTNSWKEESLTTKLTQDQRVLLFGGQIGAVISCLWGFFFLFFWNHSVYKRWLIVHPLVCGLLLWGLCLMIWAALVNWTRMTRAKGWADRETENTVCSHIGEIVWNKCLFYNNRRLNIQNKHCWRKLETSNWHHELNWEELKEEEEVFFRISFIWKWQTAL